MALYEVDDFDEAVARLCSTTWRSPPSPAGRRAR